jgi:hypothetical protein
MFDKHASLFRPSLEEAPKKFIWFWFLAKAQFSVSQVFAVDMTTQAWKKIILVSGKW